MVKEPTDIRADYVAKNGAPSAAAPKIFFRYYVNSSTGAKSGTMLAEVTLFLCLLTSERGCCYVYYSVTL